MSGVIKTPAIQRWCPFDWALHGQVFEYAGEFYRAKVAHEMVESCAPPKARDVWDKITTPALR